MKTAVRILVISLLWALVWGLLAAGITFVAVATDSLDAGHVTNLVPLLSGFLAAALGLLAGGAYASIAEMTAAGARGRAALGAITGSASVLLVGLVLAFLKVPSLLEGVKGLVGLVGIGAPLAAALGVALGRLSRPSHLLMSAALLLIVTIGVVCSIYLNYYHGRAVTTVWNGLEFRLPRAWFRRGGPGIDGSVTFSRHQFPWAEHVVSSITLRPAGNDFGQNSQDALRRWEQLNNSRWSLPFQYPRVIDFNYSDVRTTTNEFHCANAVSQLGNETLVEIDCIETRTGWGFAYEGTPDDASEAMSILRQGR